MTREEMAQILTTGDVPLSLRMDPQGRPQTMVRQVLAQRATGKYDGMSYEQVLAKLNANRAAADREP